MRDSFSQHLIDNIGIVLNNNQQVILFQNRRGYTPQWQCQTCGQITKCTRCDVSLTYHKRIIIWNVTIADTRPYRPSNAALVIRQI